MNIYDVSERANVSIATVSRVINGNPNVSEKTRNRVLAVMDELGYTPNVFARSLGLNTMRTIGKMKRQGRTQGRTPEVKKAIVKLKKDSKGIEFFEGMGAEA